MVKDYFNIGGIETYTNPLLADGKLIHSVNTVSFPYGAKSKRPGYTSFLGTPDTSQVQSLFDFSKEDGTTLWLYRASGTSLYYSQQGTGAWTLAGNGTIASGAHFGQAILGNTLIGGDGVGSTRYTTSGTAFTNATLAPVAQYFSQYQRRIYAGGTSSTLFYSVTNDATNWNLAGTADSSSFTIPGEGANGQNFVNADRLFATKTRNTMFSWDGFSLVDMATDFGPSSPYSVGNGGYNFWINQRGVFGFDGSNPKLLSNPIQRQFYNRKNTGIAGTAFASLPGVCHMYDYLASVGTITDDFTGRTISNAIIKYDFKKNEFLNWSFADNPTSYLSYLDTGGTPQLIFGNSTGQVFQLDNTKTSDNGAAIPSEMVYIFTMDTVYQKKWNWIRLFFNPGCEMNIQCAFTNTYTYERLKWVDIVDNSPNQNQNTEDGIVEFRFPQDSRSRLMFLRTYESSFNSQWSYYGCEIDAEPMQIR